MISLEEKIEEVRCAYSSFKTRKEAQEYISSKFDVTHRTVRNWAKLASVESLAKKIEVEEIAKKRELSSSKYYIFSWGQKSTPAHIPFMDNMEAYARYIGAEIGIIAGRYKNPTSIFKDDEDDEWWDSRVEGHLTLNRHKVHKYLSILADIKVVPTASTPMSGFEGFESEVSIIIGHPRVQMKVVPTLEGYRKKEIFTTGSCTVKNYTDSKSGKKGEFHHTLGFVIVEIDGDEFYMRHVTACDDGSFIDLHNRVCNSEVMVDTDCISVYACGDKHFGETDMNMEMHGRNMILRLNPDYVRLDDIFNGHSVNPHEGNDPVQRFKRFRDGETILDNELEMLKFNLSWYNDQKFKVIIPRCNHDIFLDRHIASQDWKKDIPNALSYMKCATVLLEELAPKGLIPYYINKWYPSMITLHNDESFRIHEWEQSVHGHMGANGSRGSVIQFKRLSTKMFTAHTHSPSRYDGVVTVGTNTELRVGYNKGASSWMHCDAISHRNGKAQQLIYHNYKFTTLL